MLMSDQRPATPYKTLGQYLKGLRQEMKETLAEVSGAVEIDEDLLKRIEGGHIRPSEDILLLLISHFDMQEKDAARVWRLAGYEEQPHEHSRHHDRDSDDRDDDQPSGRSTVLVMAVDPRVMYSDGVQISAGSNGVIINFAQASGTANALVTARIGMSRQQAYRVLETLQATLYKSEPRQLPATSSDTRHHAENTDTVQQPDATSDAQPHPKADA